MAKFLERGREPLGLISEIGRELSLTPQIRKNALRPLLVLARLPDISSLQQRISQRGTCLRDLAEGA
jgi:hypothetical protein